MSEHSIRTIQFPHTCTIEKVKGSRFIADVTPIEDEASALAFVARIKRRESRASHHCWAFRLADGRERSSDDGEPGGTAGPPILQRIVGQNLHGVIVVVTRYYGGTNLGTGGLIRAYGAAASAVLESAAVAISVVTTQVRFRYAYTHSQAVDAALSKHHGTIASSDYADSVNATASLPVGEVDDFIPSLSESTSGQVIAAVIDPRPPSRH